MLAVLGFLAFGAAIAWIELPRLLNDKRTKELRAFYILLGIAVIGNIVISLPFEIPSPLLFIDAVFKPLGKAFLKLLS